MSFPPKDVFMNLWRRDVLSSGCKFWFQPYKPGFNLAVDVDIPMELMQEHSCIVLHKASTRWKIYDDIAKAVAKKRIGILIGDTSSAIGWMSSDPILDLFYC